MSPAVERILVKPWVGVSSQAASTALRATGANEVETLAEIQVKVIRVPATKRAATVRQLRRQSIFEFVEEERLTAPALIPNDPSYRYQWHLQKIEAPAAWDICTGSRDVVIAILDTGVDAAHPDLLGKLVPGWNAYDGNTNTADIAGHGTPVAGIAAASANNGLGIASLAWNCLIQPVRISDNNGLASSSDIAKGLIWAADHGARVANISYPVTSSPTVRNAAQYFQSKGGVVTISAGNDGSVSTIADNPYVLTVSATDENDLVPNWSTTGSSVDLSAPGTNIRTTSRGGGYGSATGTSASAPIIGSLAALIFSVNPDLTGDQVQTILKQSADDLGPAGWDPRYGWGRVNARKAAELAAASAPDFLAPTVTMENPAPGSTVSGAVSIAVSAADDRAVAKVEWYLDGALMGTSANQDVVFVWDTSEASDGPHMLQARAYDLTGNIGSSTPISVMVTNTVGDSIAPIVRIESPCYGDGFGPSENVSVKASDNIGVTRLELYVDGRLLAEICQATAVFKWHPKPMSRQHTLQAVAYDAAGNIGASRPVVINPAVSVPQVVRD